MQNLKRNGALLLQGALVVTFWVLAALRQDDNDWTPAVPILTSSPGPSTRGAAKRSHRMTMKYKLLYLETASRAPIVSAAS